MAKKKIKVRKVKVIKGVKPKPRTLSDALRAPSKKPVKR